MIIDCMIDFLIIKLSNHSKVNKLRAERHTHVYTRAASCVEKTNRILYTNFRRATREPQFLRDGSTKLQQVFAKHTSLVDAVTISVS